MRWSGVRIFTVGHSTLTSAEFIALLRAFAIDLLVDIRTIPRSRHNPQFGETRLRKALGGKGLQYVHLPSLGGLRRPRPDSVNTAWRNTSFRGYADYMQTEAFAAGLKELRAVIGSGRAALMCAEAVPWRCHRSLVADALTARGAKVEHLVGARSSPHHLTRFAKVEGTRVTYPPGEGWLLTKGPFHLEATVRVLQRRPQNLVEVWAGDRYQRLIELPDGPRLVEVTNQGTIDQPDVRFTVLRGAPAPTELTRTLRRVLGLDVDPAPLRRLMSVEPRLQRLELALHGMRPPRFTGLFETFGNVVPFQQVSLEAGLATVSKLTRRFGTTLEHDGRTFHAFPSAEVLAPARLDTLRKCGLSRTKAEALRHVARRIAEGTLTEAQLDALPTDEALRVLRELPGIGPWSAALVLLRGMGRLEVFPPGDVGAARGLERLLERPAGPAHDDLLRRFGVRRGYLYFCSLGASLLARGRITPAASPDGVPESEATSLHRPKRFR